tara:strand:- start:80 stop:496 length:417 start_codon:yes stop_codon:yes gene_type:complete
MKILMSKPELELFMKKEFSQVSKNFKILDLDLGSISMKMNVLNEHLRPGDTISGPTMFLLADISFYLATLSLIGPKSLTVTTNCSINFLRKPNKHDLTSKARVLKIGKTLSVGDVLIYSLDKTKPVAHASLTYSIPKN